MKLIFIMSLFFGSVSFASEFCDGFEEGYKTVKGSGVFVPHCPFEPFTPYNSTPYREGIKAGIKKARE